jgi:D-alanyl-D-alanine carboxypeptidase
MSVMRQPLRPWAFRLLVALMAAAGMLVAAVGITVAIDRIFFSQETRAQVCPPQATATSRPELQRTLDGVVGGPSELAPGATAYVSGPNGRWLGAAGVVDVNTCAPMPVDARMRLESVSKIYTAALILQLAQEKKLSVGDTVERWLPRVLPYGDRITIRQLLTMSSGLVDNNDFNNAPPELRRIYLGRVKDPELRAELFATSARVQENPATVVQETLWIRWAAWQPLLFTPGSGHHYSNIGYDILGLVAEHAGGEPLAALYRERIFQPLGLDSAAYEPQGPMSDPHAEGYGIEPNGVRIETTDWHWGVGAEGGIVSNAEDTARFLKALMRGRVIDESELAGMRGENLWLGGAYSGCADPAFGWSGGGSGFKTEVWVNEDGSRVAVLLLNARHYGTAQPAADQAAHDALADLYCGA